MDSRQLSKTKVTTVVTPAYNTTTNSHQVEHLSCFALYNEHYITWLFFCFLWYFTSLASYKFRLVLYECLFIVSTQVIILIFKKETKKFLHEKLTSQLSYFELHTHKSGHNIWPNGIAVWKRFLFLIFSLVIFRLNFSYYCIFRRYKKNTIYFIMVQK